MSHDFLSRLYWVCADEAAPLASGLNLGELYERTEDAAAANKAFDHYLSSAMLSAESRTELEHLDSLCCIAYEKQGFINGFRLGVKLIAELGGEAAGLYVQQLHALAAV